MSNPPNQPNPTTKDVYCGKCGFLNEPGLYCWRCGRILSYTTVTPENTTQFSDLVAPKPNATTDTANPQSKLRGKQ